jgi:hypothetical protein
LTVGAQLVHDAADLPLEPHLEHAVGLVQHEERHAPAAARLLPQQVQQAAGRGHHCVAARLERSPLLVHVHAAEHRHYLAPLRLGQTLRHLQDLFGEFSGGPYHQPDRPLAPRQRGLCLRGVDTIRSTVVSSMVVWAVFGRGGVQCGVQWPVKGRLVV